MYKPHYEIIVRLLRHTKRKKAWLAITSVYGELDDVGVVEKPSSRALETIRRIKPRPGEEPRVQGVAKKCGLAKRVLTCTADLWSAPRAVLKLDTLRGTAY